MKETWRFTKIRSRRPRGRRCGRTPRSKTARPCALRPGAADQGGAAARRRLRRAAAALLHYPRRFVTIDKPPWRRTAPPARTPRSRARGAAALPAPVPPRGAVRGAPHPVPGVRGGRSPLRDEGARRHVPRRACFVSTRWMHGARAPGGTGGALLPLPPPFGEVPLVPARHAGRGSR